MTQPTLAPRRGHPLPLPPATFAGFALALIAVLVIAGYSFLAQRERIDMVARLSYASAVVERAQLLLSTAQDAETGQRGYLLTGNDQYLVPFTQASAEIESRLQQLRALEGTDVSMTGDLQALQQLTDAKFGELRRTIRLKQSGDTAGALAVVTTDEGKLLMDRIRSRVGSIRDRGQQIADEQRAAWTAEARTSLLLNASGSLMLMVLIGLAAGVARRDFRRQARETWLRAGQSTLAEQLQGERRLEVLGERAMAFFIAQLHAPVGTLHLVAADGRLRRIAAHAVPADQQVADISRGQDLPGQVVKDGRLLHVRDVPAGYWRVASSVGAAAVRELVIAPARVEGTVYGLLELGFLRPVTATELELLERTSEMLGIAVRSARDRSRLEELLEESQRQAEELQTQQEELRVTNEELEERGQALSVSQAQLETQQAELEQSNTQLGEQARLLERQNDRLLETQRSLEDKATELERASQYKSEFLANMSHELRTPLNSSLILAKLLADNAQGNLNDEQVQFAQTIHSAGHDLLVLINDILELSKIEAGQLTVVRETVDIAGCIGGAIESFRAEGQQRGLTLEFSIDPGVPTTFESDSKRLAQILRNLLANALKFTAQGSIRLQVRCEGESLTFAVTDTGIGIAAEQQQLIFEAFRQADGSIQRRYGGTGLGLSISRDLAQLLGGNIQVSSQLGTGSTFTLTLPVRPEYAMSSDAREASTAAAPSPVSGAAAVLLPRAPALATAPEATVEDDRNHLTPGKRLILVIEDDVHFAAILRDVAHELDFDCILVGTAEQGVAAAARYKPSGILLDIRLPDGSGLDVLDRLKRNPQLRHIPVHAVSVDDFTYEAMSRGAVGYALKPLPREGLVSALRRLEATFTPRMRRLLVVEDDERQRRSIAALLNHRDVDIVGVATAAEALSQLRSSAFDCLVMDLNLPDMSGSELLEKIAHLSLSSPPAVIVYTGRSLTREEEQHLQHHSQSIIVKGARSPERLLDEVTLFLHQVEADLPPESRRLLRAARDRDAAFEGRRILIAEDDVRNIFALSRILEPKGAKVEIARNGREALDLLERSVSEGAVPIDLVLMDLMMPEMDGLAAIREIRGRPQWQQLPIIALTAKAMQDDRDACLAAGANDYIAKPLDVDKLIALIRLWIRS